MGGDDINTLVCCLWSTVMNLVAQKLYGGDVIYTCISKVVSLNARNKYGVKEEIWGKS